MAQKMVARLGECEVLFGPMPERLNRPGARDLSDGGESGFEDGGGG
jgi:hypothetical protein